MGKDRKLSAAELESLTMGLSRLFDTVRLVHDKRLDSRSVSVEQLDQGQRVVFAVPVRTEAGEAVLECSVHTERTARDDERLYTDGLTGARNRLYFEEGAFITVQGCEVSFVMTDVRDFKYINDTYGHPVGDLALKKTVEVMKSHLRATDAVIRMGGDEFLIVLFHCSREAALRVAEKIRDTLLQEPVFDEAPELHAYLNVGVASRKQFDAARETWEAMYAEADREMYLDKNS